MLSLFGDDPADVLMSAVKIPENLECNDSSARVGPAGETITIEIWESDLDFHLINESTTVSIWTLPSESHLKSLPAVKEELNLLSFNDLFNKTFKINAALIQILQLYTKPQAMANNSRPYN